MSRRVTVVAAGVDVVLLVLFLFFGSPLLAWVNVASIALYGGAYWLLLKRINTPALLLIWLEVLGHVGSSTHRTNRPDVRQQTLQIIMMQ